MAHLLTLRNPHSKITLKGVIPVGMITLKEYAERNGKNHISTVQKAARGGFRTARKIGCQWFIDEDEPFTDGRVKSGKYVGFRDRLNTKKE